MSKMKEEAARLAAAAVDPAMLPSFSRRSPRVAMNTVTDFTGELTKVENELVAIKAKLAEHEGSYPTRKLDARLIKPSRFANRLEESFEASEFQKLKTEIANAGGNVQAIKVRPLGADEYEIAFGHRRHRACLDLDLPVLAMIADLSDKELFEDMTRENDSREDLSPYEWAMHYKRGIDNKLYKNWADVAASLGKTKGLVSRFSALAELPKSIVEAFPSKNDIQPKWAAKLRQVLDADTDAVLIVAKEIKGKSLRAKEVFELLINQTPRKFTRVNFGKLVWSETDDGIKIEIERKSISTREIDALRRFLKDTFEGLPG